MVVEAIFNVLELLEQDETGILIKTDGADVNEDTREALVKKVGDIIADRVWKSGRMGLVTAILEAKLGTAGAGVGDN